MSEASISFAGNRTDTADLRHTQEWHRTEHLPRGGERPSAALRVVLHRGRLA
jgi:hypothetical protein